MAVDADQVLEPVELRPLEADTPDAVCPGERRPLPRARDLLPEHYFLEAMVGVGERELDRVVGDAGAAQCFFFCLFCRARILCSRTRSKRRRWLRRASIASISRCSFA